MNSTPPDPADTVLSAVGDAPGPRRVSVGFIVALAVANFGIWIALLTPVIVTLQLKVVELVSDAAARPRALSVILVVGSVAGIVVNPIAGRLSDRTTSRFGMRRPWLLGGAVLLVIGAVMIGVSSGLGLAIAGWLVTMVGLNILLAVLTALVPDHVPERRRGLVSGMMGVGQALGGLIGAGLAFGLSQAPTLLPAFLVPALIAAVTIVIVLFVLKDRRITRAERPPLDLAAFFASFWVSPRRAPDFAWAWASRFLMFLGLATVINYQLYYLVAQLGFTEATATALVPAGTAAQTIAVILVSAIFAPLSDRIGRRKIFVTLAALVGVVGFTLMGFATALPMYFVAMALVGAAQGVYFSVDLALVTDVLPSRERDAGKDIGVFNLSNLIPQFVGPAIAPFFLAVPVLSVSGQANQNFTVLYMAGAVFAIASAITVLRVRGAR
ncbi:MFS transporter [Microbacterium horticulturae]|uniref:MFS transporter n=1 Tax=Microbacterium horticulturae TaxID=3028316 RepID=A0ABY8C188_9MICO|nr:MFS transporter [Microbacterium sp. KACC 23027]WEG08418.1 MFS transporter [Microbacterium sp. KACC 23027]